MLSSFLNVLVVTGIVTWRAPDCIAVSAARSVKIREKLAAKRYTSESTNPRSTAYSRSSAQPESGM